MKKDLVLFVAISSAVLLSHVQAQTQPQASAPTPALQTTPASQTKSLPRAPLPVPQSSYCLPVSAGFLESEAKASDEMKRCSRGDTIVVPARSPGAVARMCDFSKAIVALGENVVCMMIFPERASK
jgi:hypothetical protein